MTAVAIHRENPKLLHFRGNPVILICATEHYGAVMNRPFDFSRYLTDAAEKRQTLSRLFLLFRELQSAVNPFSSCKPDSTDYIAPFVRSGPECALDGLPKYDLDVRNPEYFDRLHRFMNAASSAGIIVEVVLFSNSYGNEVWALNPLHHLNNVNALRPLEWFEYTTKRDPELFARQVDFTRSIVRELNCYDNIIYEVCNEPGGDFPHVADAPTSEEVNEWIAALIEEIRSTEAVLPNQHLVAGQEAFRYQLPNETLNSKDVHQFAEKSFHEMDYDIVNMHPLSNMWHRGMNYDLGMFMRGSLRIRALRDYCVSLYAEGKPLNLDEDNAASRFMDPVGWTIHRKRAWTTIFSGAHYDVIDFSINRFQESGTSESQAHLRKWMRILSEFIHSVDLVRMKPCRTTVKSVPPDVCPSVIRISDEEVFVYLADERETANPHAGELIQGHVTMDLANAEYEVGFFCPTEGSWTLGGRLHGKRDVPVTLPAFQHDIVLRLRRL